MKIETGRTATSLSRNLWRSSCEQFQTGNCTKRKHFWLRRINRPAWESGCRDVLTVGCFSITEVRFSLLSTAGLECLQMLGSHVRRSWTCLVFGHSGTQWKLTSLSTFYIPLTRRRWWILGQGLALNLEEMGWKVPWRCLFVAAVCLFLSLYVLCWSGWPFCDGQWYLRIYRDIAAKFNVWRLKNGNNYSLNCNVL